MDADQENKNAELERIAANCFVGFSVRAVVNSTRQELFDLLVSREVIRVDKNDCIQCGDKYPY